MQSLRAGKPKAAPADAEALLKKMLTKSQLRHIKMSYGRGGRLYINVDSSAWLYQLNLKKPQLLARLGAADSGIKDIRFRLGEI
jgi:predicted nucleic acid-binding Zn ribbon protein